MKKMKKERTELYININTARQEVIYSGIDFAEFIQYLFSPIQNMLLLKSDYIGEKCVNNFEVIEGAEEIKRFNPFECYAGGDFCFVDYSIPGAVEALKQQEIAELLYFAHMKEPLNLSFFSALQNRFVYLSHDDGWYCKLYCHDLREFVPVFLKKLFKKAGNYSTDLDALINLLSSGVLVDLTELRKNPGIKELKLYSVGDSQSMDDLLNNFQQIKSNAIKKSTIRSDKDGIHILE